MCFKPPYTTPTSKPPQWWLNSPPKLEDPKVKLNEDATESAKKRRRAIGTQKLQLPLTPKGSTSGLGIPTK